MNSTPATSNVNPDTVAPTTMTTAPAVPTGKAPAAKKAVAAKPVSKSVTKPAAKAAGNTAKVKATAQPATKAVPNAAKVAAQLVTKPIAKSAPKTLVKPDAKPVKVKKPKMVRDSFTMPKGEFAVIEAMKERAAALKVPTKKTELIRAGIKALAAMSESAFLNAVRAVPNLKTGRPAKGE